MYIETSDVTSPYLFFSMFRDGWSKAWSGWTHCQGIAGRYIADALMIIWCHLMPSVLGWPVEIARNDLEVKKCQFDKLSLKWFFLCLTNSQFHHCSRNLLELSTYGTIGDVVLSWTWPWPWPPTVRGCSQGHFVSRWSLWQLFGMERTPC